VQQIKKKKIEHLDVLKEYYLPNKHFAPLNCTWHEACSEETIGPVEHTYFLDYAVLTGTSYTSISKDTNNTVA
jgi:hypothetical protein